MGSTLLVLIGAYLLAGLVVGLGILVRPRFLGDPVYRASALRVRVVVLPGVMVLWPIVLVSMRVPPTRDGAS